MAVGISFPDIKGEAQEAYLKSFLRNNLRNMEESGGAMDWFDDLDQNIQDE